VQYVLFCGIIVESVEHFLFDKYLPNCCGRTNQPPIIPQALAAMSSYPITPFRVEE
jgi:hypothetical protein